MKINAKFSMLMNLIHNYIILLSLLLLTVSLLMLFFWKQDHTWWLPKKIIYSNKEKLPFDRILDDHITVCCKDNTLFQVIKIEGIDYSMCKPEEIARLSNSKKMWLDEIAKHNAHVRIITQRKKRNCKLYGKMPNHILQSIHDKWMQTFHHVYSNEHYIILMVSPQKQFLKKQTANLEKMTNLTQITLEGMTDYKPTLVKHSVLRSDLLEVLGNLINRKAFINKTSYSNINDYVSCSATRFDTRYGLIQQKEGINRRYIQALSLIRWGEKCNAELMKILQSLDSELIILHHLNGQTPLESISKLKYHSKQAAMDFGGVKKQQEYEEVILKIQEKKETLFYYQLTIFILSDKISNLYLNVEKAKKHFRQYGAVPLHENLAIEWLWRSMFPGYNQLVYGIKMLTSQLSNWLLLEKEPQGLQKCDWGSGPIRFFKTASNGIYSLQLHATEQKESLGNSLIIAPAGCGKTTFFQHLIGGALRHNIKSYIFDRYNGTKIFTEAVGGTYVHLSHQNIQINPFACADTPDNRNFIFQLLLLLSGIDDETVYDQVSKAVDLIFNLPIEKRILNNFYDLAFMPNSHLKQRLSPWVGNNVFGKWLNGCGIDKKAYDSLSLQENHLISFEMTDIQSNSKLAACMMYYLMHTIRQMAQKHTQGHLIFIDETKPMLADLQFQKHLSELFLEHRKLRGSINVCFQDCKFLVENAISNIILEQCPTKFIFPNYSAKKEHYDGLEVNAFEWDYIKGDLPISKVLKHSVLVKKQNESVILNIDMHGLGNYLKLYKSGTESISLATELRQKWGHNQWQEKYLHR